MDPVKFSLIAGPIALIVIAIIQGFFAVKVAEVHNVVVKVEEQTNSRLSHLLEKVEQLESRIAAGVAARTDAKLDKISEALVKSEQTPP
jgi:hypothetical protein